MSRQTPVQLHWAALLTGAVILLAAGAGGAYLTLRYAERGFARDGATAPVEAGRQGVPPQAPTPDGPLPEATVSLSQEAIQRAGIVVQPVLTGRGVSSLRLPGIVEPNAYRQVAVTPLTGGRVTSVTAELGQQVRKGQTMAQIFSPEVAEAQTGYISARAELEAHEKELARTRKLVEIGAASQQELERIHAEHSAQAAMVQSARSRLELLGVPAEGREAETEIAATIGVPAPITGVVTERLANVGLNVDPAAKLFTVLDLSTVWVMADLYEKDFSRVRLGTPVTITTAAYPDSALRGRVSYIDPQVRPETRTAKVRVEVQNPRAELRLGMYAEVMVQSTSAAQVPIIPRSALQTVGDRQVVYLAHPAEPRKFTETPVQLGPATGDRVEVISGLRPGDSVVTQGSFFVRAEKERLGGGNRLPAAAPEPTRRARQDAAPPDRAPTNVQAVTITIGQNGFEPPRVTLNSGTPARLTLVRTTDQTCATEVVFPALNIRRSLPLNQPVSIEFTPAKAGEIAFSCGMGMLHGTIVVAQ